MLKGENFFSKSGFTLVEMLLSMVIVGIVFTFATTSYITAQRRIIFDNTVSEIVANIKSVRNLAISSKTTNIGGSQLVPAGGYGVLVSRLDGQGQVTPFADTWNEAFEFFANPNEFQEISNGVFEKVPADKLYTEGNGNQSDTQLDLYQLPDSVFIESINITRESGAEENVNQVHILFTPPFADTKISDSSGLDDIVDVEIVLVNDDSTENRRTNAVRLNRISGLPETNLNAQ